MSDLTIKALRGDDDFSYFTEIYKSFILNKVNEGDMLLLLETAIAFLNCRDKQVQNFGYKIILEHALKTRDYKPLYDISINLGYIPVAKLIELTFEENNFSKSFIRQFYSSYKDTFKDKDNKFLTIGQIQLNNEIKRNTRVGKVIVAPTSYGKSEAIVELAKTTDRCCIIVPTKALLAQTKKRILDSGIDFSKKPLLVHNEMFSGKIKNFIAVLTQERLMSVLQEFPNLYFDKILVDEAHNLLDKEDRARLLAASIIVLKKRSPDAKFYYFTPFLNDIANLQLKFIDIENIEIRKNEYIKSEKIFVSDFRERKPSKLQIYDQFMDSIYDLPETYKNEVELIQKNTKTKSIIYTNLPKDVEEFARKFILNLQDVKSEVLDDAISSLKEYIHDDYFLLKCLKKGVAYHHGGMPDNVKLFVEHLYSTEPLLKFMISTSTLLEGVNIPADQIYLLSLYKGDGNLTSSHLKNLIGRVSRFSDIFANAKSENLEMLMPKIFIVGTKYTRSNTNFKNFLSKNLAINLNSKDKVENELLRNTKKADEQTQISYVELIETVEPEATGQENVRTPVTNFGRSCFKNRIVEFDIFDFENEGQKLVDQLLYAKKTAKNEHEIMANIHDLFVNPLLLNYMLENDTDKINPYQKKFYSFYSLDNQGARNLHAMYLRWKEKGTSYRQMISTVVEYWQKNNENGLIYVGRWGDSSGPNGGVYTRYIDTKKKTKYELNNYAIVRIKDEQDFIEYNLFKFIDVMNDLNLVDANYFKRLKYGTENEKNIFLIKNGISTGLSKILLKNYSSYIHVNVAANEYSIEKDIVEEMINNSENLIHLNEIRYHIKK